MNGEANLAKPVTIYIYIYIYIYMNIVKIYELARAKPIAKPKTKPLPLDTKAQTLIPAGHLSIFYIPKW